MRDIPGISHRHHRVVEQREVPFASNDETRSIDEEQRVNEETGDREEEGGALARIRRSLVGSRHDRSDPVNDSKRDAGSSRSTRPVIDDELPRKPYSMRSALMGAIDAA